nr:glycoside hydrolase family 3 N-terminal domain-containing protein [Sphingomonas parva]
MPLTAGLARAETPAARPLYKDASQPVDLRVEDLLARMTLEEKVAQLLTVGATTRDVLGEGQRFDPAKAEAAWPDGIGQIARPSDARRTAPAGEAVPSDRRWRTPAETAEFVNAVQRHALTRTRLGIPVLFHEEALHGYMATEATMFPQAIALASSWDPELVRRVNETIAREVRVRGVSLVLSPVVDIARDPRWGRIEETFGEDPYLAGELGVAAVLGLQGEGRTLRPGKVFATLKHMTGHGQPQAGNNVAPAPLGERELREFFFPPFEQVVTRTGIEAVMASYNEIDGVPSHANRWLLQDVLRGEWGFRGAVVSDYSGVDELATFHHVAPDIQAAAIRAISAGVDSDLPEGLSYRTLVQAVRDGRVSEGTVDGAVRRILSLKFRAGLFENPYADPKAVGRVTGNAEARTLALEAARKSIVLLRNDGILPLAPGAHRRIAVIGPNAAVTRLGGYSSFPRQSVSLLDGIKARVGSKAEVVHAQGVFITRSEDRSLHEVELADPVRNRELIAEAVETARGADLVILAIGDTEQTSREGFAKNHLGDRTSLDLVGEQNELAAALFALGKPVVVMALNGRPPSWPMVAERANALVENWYVGQEGGTAMAQILFGDANPGGKLPVTVARSVGQVPLYYNHKPSVGRGYLFDTTAPLFPFGYGLSYTRFELSAPRLSQRRIRSAGTVDVEVDVANVGPRTGDEVVQIYVCDEVATVTRPIKELKAFRRVTLQPGERRTLRFSLGPEAFRMWNADMRRLVEPGAFEIMAGNSSAALKSATLVIEE